MKGMEVRCPGCQAPMLDTGEGHLVTRNGVVHDCEVPEKEPRARRPEDVPEGWEFTIQRPSPIEMPPPRDHRVRYPWEHMEPGDMFFAACDPEDRKAVVNRIASTGSYWCRANAPDRRVLVRQVRGGVRAWMLMRPEEVER